MDHSQHKPSHRDSDQRSADSAAFGALALRYLDGELSPSERVELQQQLANDAAAREQFVQLCVDVAQFAEIFAADQLTQGEPDDGPLVKPQIAPAAGARPAWQWFARPVSISLLIAAVAIGTLLGLLAWNNAPVFPPSNQRLGWAQGESQFVARLARTSQVRWAEGESEFAAGTLLRAGEQLALASGTADIVFNQGAQVTLEGPARFYVVAPDVGQLESGRLASYVPPAAIGFAIQTEQVEVVDLGTQFGIIASGRGETEVHVFQGAVRVEAYNAETRRELLAGQALKVRSSGRMVALASQPGKFAHRPQGDADAVAAETAATIVDDFDSSHGQLAGWASSWTLHGSGRVHRDTEDAFATNSGAYLRVEATNAEVRSLRREYQKFGNVDPAQPHIIRWKWRFEGDPQALTTFHDRIHFFADAQPYAGTTFSNAWLIAIAFGVENEAQPPVGKWVFFDSRKSGKHSDAFVERNMANTGMSLRPGVVYSFEVRVDPQTGTYGATIDDGREKFSAEGLHFRSGKPGVNPVLHFGGCASKAGENQAFSLDSIEILPQP
jgi:hypothetical protein